MTTLELKACCTCKQPQPLSEFNRDKNRRDGLYASCRTCQSARTKQDYRANGERRRTGARWNIIKSKYGLSRDDYEAMSAAQDGTCAICRQVPIGGFSNWDGLVVDHDHATNQVRGLLCNNCNVALGLMRDDPTRLIEAAKYLETYYDNTGA